MCNLRIVAEAHFWNFNFFGFASLHRSNHNHSNNNKNKHSATVATVARSLSSYLRVVVVYYCSCLLFIFVCFICCIYYYHYPCCFCWHLLLWRLPGAICGSCNGAVICGFIEILCDGYSRLHVNVCWQLNANWLLVVSRRAPWLGPYARVPCDCHICLAFVWPRHWIVMG